MKAPGNRAKGYQLIMGEVRQMQGPKRVLHVSCGAGFGLYSLAFPEPRSIILVASGAVQLRLFLGFQAHPNIMLSRIVRPAERWPEENAGVGRVNLRWHQRAIVLGFDDDASCVKPQRACG